MYNISNFCAKEYSVLIEENGDFDCKWTDSNNTCLQSANSDVNSAFHFTDSNKINSYPYSGIYSTYIGGGYVFEMKNIADKQDVLLENLDKLKEMSWIDRQTRAVFLEFTLFNPNINLFSHCLILFEFIPTGNIITSSQFNPIDLIDINKNNIISFKIIINVVYIVLLAVYTIKEMIHIYKYFKTYFTQLYNYIELFIIGFSWAAFVFYLYRLYSSNDIFKSIAKSESDSQSTQNLFINLQYVCYCNDLLKLFLGFCVTFGTIRFIKILRYNKVIIVFVEAFSKSLRDLGSFFVVFILVCFTFIQAMYFLFHDKSEKFNTLITAIETCFQMLLGSFDVSELSSSVFGPVFYSFYNLIIVIIIVNVFLSILIDHYGYAKENNDSYLEDPEILDYIKQKVTSLIEKINWNKKNSDPPRDKNSNQIDALSGQINKLIMKIENLYL